MPRKPQRPCSYPGCPHLTEDKTGYCDAHRKQIQRQYDQQRGTANQRGYNYRWHQYTKVFLAEHPLCALCAQKDPPLVKAAALVDHIKPHRGNYELFWDPANHQSACTECHNIKTAKEDGAFGNPSAK